MCRCAICLAFMAAALSLAGCELRPAWQPASSPPLGANPQDAEFSPANETGIPNSRATFETGERTPRPVPTITPAT